MDPKRVDIASVAERDMAIRTLTLGFLADPVARWIWPDAGTYMEAMPDFIAAFGGKAFETGSAYLAGGGKAVALWLPPETDSDGDAIDAIFEATTDPAIQDDLASLFEQMAACHPEDEPCWYLPMIAADPFSMGRGLGGAILTESLRRCDADGTVAYLESSNPRNMSLYRRHGFEAVGRIQAGSSPALVPMVRQPRGKKRPIAA